MITFEAYYNLSRVIMGSCSFYSNLYLLHMLDVLEIDTILHFTGIPACAVTVCCVWLLIWVSAEIKVYVASLSNNQTWKKLQSRTKDDYNFIKDLEDQVVGLAGKVQLDKAGGITGHIGIIMPPPEFALIQSTTAFVLEAHPGVIDYLLPAACITVQ